MNVHDSVCTAGGVTNRRCFPLSSSAALQRDPAFEPGLMWALVSCGHLLRHLCAEEFRKVHAAKEKRAKLSAGCGYMWLRRGPLLLHPCSSKKVSFNCSGARSPPSNLRGGWLFPHHGIFTDIHIKSKTQCPVFRVLPAPSASLGPTAHDSHKQPTSQPTSPL